MTETVSGILNGIVSTARALAPTLGGRAGDATLIAAALVETTEGLLSTRTPHEVITLLRDLNQDPARRAGLGATRDTVAEILARRRAEEDASE
jgi:hypothetical protein